MRYLHWDQKTIVDFGVNNITDMYEKGYVFTRIGKGVMQQTRSLRVDLAKFELNSENRRILRKFPDLKIKIRDERHPPKEYDFSIGKLAKDFYEAKFGKGIMSAQKVKEMITDGSKSNFNLLLQFQGGDVSHPGNHPGNDGYVICYSNDSILHYSYPFYDLNKCPKDMGLAMMIKTIEFTKERNKKYIYLGSLQRPSDVYKLQFAGLEWFDGKDWNNDLDKVKEILIKGGGDCSN